MNKWLTITIASIVGLLVLGGVAYALVSSANPAATPTPSETATLMPVIVTATEGATATASLTPVVVTATPSPSEAPTLTPKVITATPRVITATPGGSSSNTPQATTTGQASPTTPPATGPASVSAGDQTLASDNSLMVARVVSPSAGWITIYADEGGKPGAVLGFAPVSPGQNNNVKVTLTVTSSLPGTVWAVLLTDAGTIGTFEFPGADTPVKDQSGNFVEVSFKVTK